MRRGINKWRSQLYWLRRQIGKETKQWTMIASEITYCILCLGREKGGSHKDFKAAFCMHSLLSLSECCRQWAVQRRKEAKIFGLNVKEVKQWTPTLMQGQVEDWSYYNAYFCQLFLHSYLLTVIHHFLQTCLPRVWKMIFLNRPDVFMHWQNDHCFTSGGMTP